MPRKLVPQHTPPEAPAQHATPAGSHDAPAVPARPPIRVDLSNMEILDLPLLGEFDSVDDLPAAERVSLLNRAIPMFDRLIVGGLKGIKIDQFPAVARAVGEALRERSDAKN